MSVTTFAPDDWAGFRTILFPSEDLFPSDDTFPGSSPLVHLVSRAARHVHHLATGDPENDGILLELLEVALAGAEHLGEAAWGSDRGPGRALIDPEVAPLWALGYAAQVVLADMPGRAIGEGDAGYLERARDAVLHPPRRAAGSVGAIKAAARPFLTGTKALKVVFHVGDEFHFQVRVRSDECADAAALLAAIDDPDMIPAGQKPEVVLVSPGAPWSLAEMEEVYSGRTLAELESGFSTLSALESNPGGL